MINENKLIIKQINKFGKVPQIYELLQMIERLEQENKQLKEKLDCDLQWALKYEKQVGNWNKLKEYAKEIISTDNELYGTDLLDKMQELEGSGSNE